MMTSTVLVLLMTIPGLALFYGGLVRTKNMLSVLTHVFYTVCIVTVIWVIYGYSLAFTGGSTLHRRLLDKLFLKGVTADSQGGDLLGRRRTSPSYVYICFQMTFAAITPALIVGAFAERMKFSAVALFIPLWVTLVYFPIAHMVWYWAGPDAIDAAAKALAAAADGAAKTAAQAKLDAVNGRRRPGLPVGRHRLRRRHRGAHQRRHRRPRRRAAGRQAHRLRQGADASALADHDHDRRLAAVGRLVRLQRRLQPRSHRRRGARDDQLVRRHRRRGAVLDVRRVDGQGQALAARRVVRRGRGPRRRHAGVRLSPARWARSCSASSPAWSACSSARR